MTQLKTTDFDYRLPAERIAQTPATPRDSSRLMALRRDGMTVDHRVFRDIVGLLRPGDLLVGNESRVIPARLYARKRDTGGQVEVLLVSRRGPGLWEALVKPGRRVREGTVLEFDGASPRPDLPASASVGGSPAVIPAEAGIHRRDLPTSAVVGETDRSSAPRELHLVGEAVGRTDSGGRLIQFSGPADVEATLERLGATPLPPYIHEPLSDPERYQTVYARVKGSVAAPTAGLHFTPELIAELGAKGIEFQVVTLHIGLDTFRPVQVEDAREHRMHSEYAELTPEVASAINRARGEGRRIVVVGTTAVRVLETAGALAASPVGGPPRSEDLGYVMKEMEGTEGTDWIEGMRGKEGLADRVRVTGPVEPGSCVAPFAGWTDIFIYPGYRFRVVDALITNFHLPRSTLLMLVSAFAGRDFVLGAYEEAVREGYRFYSFGDAMLIE